jgi:hypothetical protein
MNQNNLADPSPTVGDIRWLGANSVMLLCRACQHRQIANVELLPDDVTLALIASKFVCPNCHQNGAHALPNWDAAPNQPPAASEGQESGRPSGDEGD